VKAPYFVPLPAFSSMGLPSWTAALYLGVVVTGVGYAAWYWMMARLPLGQLVAGLFIQPVVTLLLGSLWLGESLRPQLLQGAVLIFTAQALLQLEKHLPRPFFKPRISP